MLIYNNNCINHNINIFKRVKLYDQLWYTVNGIRYCRVGLLISWNVDLRRQAYKTDKTNEILSYKYKI